MSEPAATAGAPPISVAQEALWYLHLLVPSQASYNETVSIRKAGPFDVAAFRSAFNEILRRHEAWRTTFEVVAGNPVQVVHPPDDLELALLDLSGLGPADAERHAVRLVAEMSRVPYDLRRGPLVRPRLVRCSEDDHRLYLGLHHMIFDGVSLYRIVLPELVVLYDAAVAGVPAELGPPGARYGDYARFEQEWINGPRAEKRLAYWRDRLVPTPWLSLPLDAPRPDASGFRGGVVPLSVDARTVGNLRELGQAGGATLFQVLATAWCLLLARYSGQDDVAFATGADLRQRPEFESLVGYSLSPVVLRVDLGGDPTLRELVGRVRNEALDALDHLVPFERIVRDLGPEAPPGANPIYQTILIFEPPMVAPDPAWSIHLMESAIGDAVGSTRLDLELQLDERLDGHIAGRLIYDSDLFERQSAARIVEHFGRVVAALAAHPDAPALAVPLATGEDERRLAEWNATETLRPPATVHGLVAARAQRDPDAPAVVAGGRSVTYGELCRRAGHVAHRLRSAEVGEGDVVALCSEPSIDLVAAALGVLEAGAAYQLLDPTLPRDELDAMVADSGAATIYATPALATLLTGRTAILALADPSDGDAPVASSPDGEVCCLQYGPGPEAERRGVEFTHSSVVNLVRSLADEVGIVAADTLLVLPQSLFGASAVELWLALTSGAKLVLAPPDAATDGAQLTRCIAAEHASFLHATPATWRALVDSGLRASRGLVALSGGGDLDGQLAGALLDRYRVVYNAFGTPETTLYATIGRVERGRPVSIGHPIANARAHVLDAAGHRLPVGMAGRLVIAGAVVTAPDDPDDPRWIRVPDTDDERAFDTGATARWRARTARSSLSSRPRRRAATETSRSRSPLPPARSRRPRRSCAARPPPWGTRRR